MKFQNSITTNTIKKKLSDTDVNIVFDGNSLTSGVGGDNLQDMPMFIKQWIEPFAKSSEFHSFGIGGQKLQTMVTNASTKIYPLVNTNKYNILVLNEDVNGIFQGDTAENNLALMNSYIDGAKASGFNYIVTWNSWCPRLPYDLFNPSTAVLDQQEIYCNLANNNKLHSNINIDMRLLQYIGGARNQNQNFKYFNDYIHLLNNGYYLVANEIIQKAILCKFDL